MGEVTFIRKELWDNMYSFIPEESRWKMARIDWDLKKHQETKDKKREETKTSKEEQFLKGLTDLTKKTGITIGGCGCCGSPFLGELDSKDVEGHYTHDDGDTVKWESTK